ncbi:MAG: hypothetical protein QOF84_6595 [Streptomyces sp.]|jgi:anti-sigma B factor antagonist|nr:hypothetical protein [Streptomyces sp.]
MDARLVVLPVIREQTEQGVLRLSGEFDLGGCEVFTSAAEALLTAGRRWLVLDCADLTFCDSSGINALLRVWQRTQTVGGGLAVAAVGEPVQRAFDVTGLDQVLPMTADVDEAFHLIASAPAGEEPA